MNLTEKYLGEAKIIIAGKGGEVDGLVNALIGFPNDIKIMIDNNNTSGALQSLKVMKTKLIPDLEKALKKSK